MKIVLEELIITNFKGIRSQHVRPGHVTNIYGANEAGKTSLFDAFMWLLFDKDSTDRTKFNIKNQVDVSLNRADHEVQAVLRVDDRKVCLKKTYKEIWTKKRGSSTAELTGNETIYYWDDIPCKMADFQQRIAGLLKETQFKLITNTRYFNEVMTWQQRRECLMHVAGTITNDQVLDSIMTISNKHSFSDLINLLNEKKSLDDIKKQLAAEKKKIRDNLDQIPARIDELRRSVIDIPDFVKITANLQAKKAEFDQVETQLLDASKALTEQQNAQRTIQQEIYDLQSKQDKIKYDLRTRLDAEDRDSRSGLDVARHSAMDTHKKITGIEKEVSDLQEKKNSITERQVKLREQWNEVDAKTIKFDESSCICSACGQTLPDTNVKERKATALAAFNKEKVDRKAEINSQGKHLGEKIAEYETEITDLNTKKQELQESLTSFQESIKTLEAAYTQPRPIEDRIQEALSADAQFNQFGDKIKELQDSINQTPVQANQELISRKNSLSADMDSLKKELARKDQIEAAEKRIQELLDDEAKLSQQIATIEKTEFAGEQFIKAKMDLVESRIAGKFQYVKFKMFDRQVNAGEKETCETLYNGVPYSDLNTAAKVLAGMDIINTLSREFNTYAPIFIDNRESVTWLPDTESQVINLIVSPEDKVLRVETDKVMSTLFA